MVDQQAPRCISPAKTINKQLQTDENSSGRAKDYNAEAAKGLRSSLTEGEDGAVCRKDFTRVTPFPEPERLRAGKESLGQGGGSHPTRARRNQLMALPGVLPRLQLSLRRALPSGAQVATVPCFQGPGRCRTLPSIETRAVAAPHPTPWVWVQGFELPSPGCAAVALSPTPWVRSLSSDPPALALSCCCCSAARSPGPDSRLWHSITGPFCGRVLLSGSWVTDTTHDHQSWAATALHLVPWSLRSGLGLPSRGALWLSPAPAASGLWWPLRPQEPYLPLRP